MFVGCRAEVQRHLASHRYADGASPLHMAAMSLGGGLLFSMGDSSKTPWKADIDPH